MTVLVFCAVRSSRSFFKPHLGVRFLRRGFGLQVKDGKVPHVVTAEWVHEQQQFPANKLRILDVTLYDDKNAQEEYKKAHIPGAMFFDVRHGAAPTDLFPFPIPELDTFQKYVRSLGVNNSSHVIVYDNSGEPFFRVARSWWMFKLFGHRSVSALNGGLDQWLANGFPVSNTIEDIEEGDFEASFQQYMVRSFEEVKDNLDSKEEVVVDCRSPHNYSGTPEDGSTGHIPGALNMPYRPLINQDSIMLKDVEEMQNSFNEQGIDLSKPVVFSCNKGIAASAEMMAAEMCGAKSVAVYAGSWYEWKQRAEKELIVQGENPMPRE